MSEEHTSSNTQQYNPTYHQAQEERVSSFLSQTSPTKSLKEIDYILRGYMFDSEERKYKKVSDGIPDNIRLDFLQALTPHLSEDARITRLDRLQINGIMEFIIEWVSDYLDNVADGVIKQKESFTKEERTIHAYYKGGYDLKEISFLLKPNGDDKFKKFNEKWKEKIDENNSFKGNKEEYEEIKKEYGIIFNKNLKEIEEKIVEINIKEEKIRQQKVDYDIKPLEETQMTKIAFIMVSAVFYTILRSQEGVERDRIFKSLTLGENISSPQMKGGDSKWWKIWK